MRGRPKKEESREHCKTVRLDDNERERLRYLENKLGISSSEILRRGLKMLYNLEKHKE